MQGKSNRVPSRLIEVTVKSRATAGAESDGHAEHYALDSCVLWGGGGGGGGVI